MRAEVRASGSTLRKVLADNDFDRIVYSVMSDSSDSWSKKKSQLSPGVITVLSLAAAMAVPGVGSGLMGSVITAGLKSLVADLAANTATAKGNVLKGLKSLRKKGVVKSVLRSMAMVGLTTSILGGAASAHPNTDIISELTNRVITATTKSMLYAATGIVIGGEKPSKALQSAYKSAIAHTLCSTMAGLLGKAYHAGQLPDVIHEGLHGLVGVMGAKIQNRSALAGAVGAISGEVFGKLYSQNSKVFNNPNASVDDLQKAVDRGIELAEITAASVATLFKLDADTAASAAQTAVQENNLQLIIKFLRFARNWGAKFMKGGAKSSANALRLRTEFAFREAGILNKAGKLTKKAIEKAEMIDLKGEIIKNPKVVKELTKDGSKIGNWKKFRTQPSVRMPNGQRKEIHFYKNDKTHKIDYKTIDYKVKDIVKP